MLYNFLLGCFIVGLIAMCFVTPASYAKGINELDGEELSRIDKLKCWIPIYNMIKAEVQYTGERSKILLSYIVFLIALALRLLVVFVVYGFYPLQIISLVLLLFSLAVMYIVQCYVVFIVIHNAEVMGIVKTLALSIVYPLGQYYIGAFLPVAYKNLSREEETFKW